MALKVNKAGDTMSGALAMGTNNISNVGSLSGATNTRTADNILSCLTNPTSGNLATFTASNKVLGDSGILASNIVTGPVSAVGDNLASFNLTTGKIIKDSTIATSNVVLKTGTTMVGNIAMGSNNISGTGAISSNTYVAGNTISIATFSANAQ